MNHMITGHYMYVNSRNGNVGDITYLLSPEFEGGHSISFQIFLNTSIVDMVTELKVGYRTRSLVATVSLPVIMYHIQIIMM